MRRTVQDLTPAASAVTLALLVLPGCFTHDGWARTAHAEELNKERAACLAGETWQCKRLGDNLAGRSVESRASDWQQKTDLDGVRKAYRTCCRLGQGECCRSLVELHLEPKHDEEDRDRVRACTLHAPERSQAELDAERSRDDAQLREHEQYLAQTRLEERQQRDRDLAAAVGGAQSLGNNVQTSIQTGGRTMFVGTTAIGTVPGTAGSSAANETSPGQPKGDPCAPCLSHRGNMTSKCTGTPTPACYNAAAAMHECVANAPGCSTNPAQSRAEAARMRKAAQEIAR
jgi:hypothetical protein